MRRLLVIVFDYPPREKAGVQRTLRFVRHLPACGWRVDVLTPRPKPPFGEPETGAGRVVRTAHLRVFGAASAIARLLPEPRRLALLNWFALPDLFIGWFPFAASRAGALLRGGCYDAVYSTSPPETAHLVARWAVGRTSMPWVVDFRDPWTDNPIVRPATRLHARWHAQLERMVLARADAVIANTEGQGERLRRRYPNLAAKVTVIPNGYDESEFATTQPQRPRDGIMRLLYAGSFLPQHDPEPLFKGLAKFAADRPDARGRFRLRLLVPRSERRRALRYGIAHLVEEIPWQPHADAVREMLASDALLLYQAPRRDAPFWVPAKTYEYLRAGRPILAVLPPGEARELVLRSGLGRVCDPDDPASIARGLDALWIDWVAGKEMPAPDVGFVRQYDGLVLSRQLAGLLDRIVVSNLS